MTQSIDELTAVGENRLVYDTLMLKVVTELDRAATLSWQHESIELRIARYI